MQMSKDEFYRKSRWERVYSGRGRVYSFRTHPEHGYTRHWFFYGRGEDGKLERNINDVNVSAYRLRSWRLAAEMRVSDGALGCDELQFNFAVPYLFWVFLSFCNAGWLVRLTRQEYVIGRSKHGDCERALGFSWYGDQLSISLWGNSEKHWGTRFRYFDLRNVLLGRAKYSEGPRETHDAILSMPEGDYPVKVELYMSTWKRSRWPKPRSIGRATVKALAAGGIPTPGKGENSWDIGDDATFEITCPAETVDAAIERLRISIDRDRNRYGGPVWTPEAD